MKSDYLALDKPWVHRTNIYHFDLWFVLNFIYHAFWVLFKSRRHIRVLFDLWYILFLLLFLFFTLLNFKPCYHLILFFQTLFFIWFAFSGWLFRFLIIATWVLPFAGPLLLGSLANSLVIKVYHCFWVFNVYMWHVYSVWMKVILKYQYIQFYSIPMNMMNLYFFFKHPLEHDSQKQGK